MGWGERAKALYRWRLDNYLVRQRKAHSPFWPVVGNDAAFSLFRASNCFGCMLTLMGHGMKFWAVW